MNENPTKLIVLEPLVFFGGIYIAMLILCDIDIFVCFFRVRGRLDEACVLLLDVSSRRRHDASGDVHRALLFPTSAMQLNRGSQGQ